MPMPTNAYLFYPTPGSNLGAIGIAMTNTKKEVLELATSSSVPIQLGKLALTSTLTTATAQEVQLGRCTAGGSSMASTNTVVKRNTLSPSAASTPKSWASGQTDTAGTLTPTWQREIDLRAGAGWDGLPVPESRDVAPVSGWFVLWLPSVLAGTTTLIPEVEWYE